MPYKDKQYAKLRKIELREGTGLPRRKVSPNGEGRPNRIEGRAKLKLEVLTHYGPNGTLGCCWVGCDVVDIDMLSLDHINDDGCKQRRVSNVYGANFYFIVAKEKPTDLQTLCMNHQFKKRAMRPRSTQGRPKTLATQAVSSGAENSPHLAIEQNLYP
jgi:hypothetical protein